MPTVKLVSKPQYNEEEQPNPLKWYILQYYTKDKCFKNVSAPIICKDFFNDLAYTLETGNSFEIYGFNAGEFKLKPESPVRMLLTQTAEEFPHNMGILNEWLEKQSMPRVDFEALENPVGVFISIPRVYFTNTYYISLLALVIRLLNIKKKFNNMEEVIAYKTFPNKDQYKWNKVVKKKVFFNLPEEMKQYSWYCGKNINSKNSPPDYQLSSLVHNNGVLDWSKYL